MNRAQQAKLRAQAGVGKEQRQQKQDGKILHFIGQMLDELPALGHDRAEQKGAENLVDADQVGRDCAGDEKEENDRHHPLRKIAAGFENIVQPPKQLTDKEDHHQHIRNGQTTVINAGRAAEP